MKLKEVIIVLSIALTFLTLGCIGGFGTKEKIPQAKGPIEKKCIKSEGKVLMKPACDSADDFPNTCEDKIGWSGCAPNESSPHKYCECGEGMCFDGEKCVKSESE